jgi:hypothetical protein
MYSLLPSSLRFVLKTDAVSVCVLGLSAGQCGQLSANAAGICPAKTRALRSLASGDLPELAVTVTVFDAAEYGSAEEAQEAYDQLVASQPAGQASLAQVANNAGKALYTSASQGNMTAALAQYASSPATRTAQVAQVSVPTISAVPAKADPPTTSEDDGLLKKITESSSATAGVAVMVFGGLYWRRRRRRQKRDRQSLIDQDQSHQADVEMAPVNGVSNPLRQATHGGY